MKSTNKIKTKSDIVFFYYFYAYIVFYKVSKGNFHSPYSLFSTSSNNENYIGFLQLYTVSPPVR